MLRLENFSVSFSGTRVLHGLNLAVEDGEKLVVVGPNGSGKSTLALALAGVIPDFLPAQVSGEKLCSKPMLLMQDPKTQFFAMTVKEELGPGLSSAKKFGLTHLLERNVFQLSEGEKQKINLVANLFFKPETLLLDEPLELLDPLEASKFKKTLAKVSGKTLVWFDKELQGLPNARRFFLGEHEKPKLPESKSHAVQGTAAVADFSVQKSGFSLKASLSVRNGEKIALIGANGSGKTTLLKAIAGIEKFVGKVSLSSPVSFAPQNPSHLFFNETAEAELVEPRNALRLGIGHLLKQNPVSLSKGQQKMLSIATIKSKGIALLDEPTTWLDLKNKAMVYRFIAQSRQPMVIATHDKNLLTYCDRVFLLKGGEALECSSTAANRFFQV